MINLILKFCFLSILVTESTRIPTDLQIVPSSPDTLTDQRLIDQIWEDCMITAPATINLLGQVMVVSSKIDVSFHQYSPNRVYQHIKYPNSFQATLLQVSNEGYQAFFAAHTSMNRIQLYMQQIPANIKTIIRLVSSQSSSALIGSMLPKLTNTIERIGKTCVTLANSTENAFVNVMNLIAEVLEATQETQGLHQQKVTLTQIEINVTRILHTEMKREEEIRRQRYEEVRESVRKAQKEYSQALQDLPSGSKALGIELGRAVIKLCKSYSESYVHTKLGGVLTKAKGFTFAKDQVLNFASRFADSVLTLITRLGSNNKTIDSNDLKSYKVIFKTFAKMISTIPNSDSKQNATALVQRAVQIIDKAALTDPSCLKSDLEALCVDLQPFMIAEQIDKKNNAPIGSLSIKSTSSQMELLKAHMAHTRLSEVERRLDETYKSQMTAMEQMRTLTKKLSELKIDEINFVTIVEMLRQAFDLLASLKTHWHKLVDFFSDLSARVEVGFQESLTTFVGTANENRNTEIIEIDRILILEFLNGHSESLFRQSLTLFIMARTYFDVSRKYLTPRLASLAEMLSARDDRSRRSLMIKLKETTFLVQAKVKEMINQRREIYQRVITEKRAEFNETVETPQMNGNAIDMINQAKLLLDRQDDSD